MKKLLAFILALTMCLTLAACANTNGHNSIGTNVNTALLWFSDTGIRVKNHQDRVYSIVKDTNGFLYYCSDVEGNLTPVYDEDGLPTKSLDIFN